jgi:hypothetical protein
MLRAPNFEAIEFAADYYRSRGRLADATAALARLDAVSAARGRRSSSSQPRVPQRRRGAATLTSRRRHARRPRTSRWWRQRFGYDWHPETPPARREMRNSRSLLPHEPGLAAFLRQADRFGSLQQRCPEFGGLLNELLDSPDAEQDSSPSHNRSRRTTDVAWAGEPLKQLLAVVAAAAAKLPFAGVGGARQR